MRHQVTCIAYKGNVRLPNLAKVHVVEPQYSLQCFLYIPHAKGEMIVFDVRKTVQFSTINK